MKRAILIDGNNLLFRSYYATAYTGNMMKNSKGVPTNAVFGFVNMINKIVKEEEPEYILVAFDKGKNFRHKLYKNYKDGRIETPHELLSQFPLAKEFLDYKGIKHLEIDDYEADDIIGTFAKMADEDKSYDATIISSDKDLLQLIGSDVSMKLLKQKDYIFYNEEEFIKAYNFEPIHIIDLKALEGDKSDNIPGVKGIGEKTALTLISQYKTIENLYDHIDELKGKLKEKLITDKENAEFSKMLATIYKDIKFDLTFEDLKIKNEDTDKLIKFFEELEFYSFIKNMDVTKKEKEEIINLKDISFLDKSKEFSFYLELDNENYHKADIIGMSLYDGENSYYLTKEEIINNKDIFNSKVFSYDVKKAIGALNKYGIKINYTFDTLIAAYLLELNVKDDIAYLANQEGYNINFYEDIISKKKKLTEEEIKKSIILKSKFIYETKEKYINLLKENELLDLYNNIELPLVSVLADMEINGVYFDSTKIDELKSEIEIKLEKISNDIYNMAGCEFNISSPQQVSDVLFNKLAIPTIKKGKKSTSTSHLVLTKLIGVHPIVESIIEYRNLKKLYTTYLEPLKTYVMEDGKIHTIFKQNVTRTGRLSSIEPNLQNIPIRSEEGRKIRKAFVPSENSIIVSADYSQIELRILAHISQDENLIEAFNHKEDIHTIVASDIYGTPVEAVTKTMRRTAKAVIFGIVYGISGYGLGDNLDISPKEAKKFIDKYLTLYPGVKKYMDDIVKLAYEKGSVRTIMNRKRTIEELKNTNYMIRQAGERIALNTPIQGSSADIIKKAMIDINESFKKHNLKSKMILQIHDELIFDTLKTELKDVLKIVTEVMENVYKLKVPLKIEISYGDNLYDAK